jgi:hypothetical protein
MKPPQASIRRLAFGNCADYHLTYRKKKLRMFGMYRSWLFLLALPVMFTVCKSPPQAVEIPSEKQVILAIGDVEPQNSAPENISTEITQEEYNQTLAEVQHFIENLNKIIRDKNYTAWKDSLTEEYFDYVKSNDFLSKASESLIKRNHAALKGPDDYFLRVVVPSRANSQVDEIEFIDHNWVKAYFYDKAKTRRLRLYELIKTGDKWKIIS